MRDDATGREIRLGFGIKAALPPLRRRDIEDRFNFKARPWAPPAALNHNPNVGEDASKSQCSLFDASNSAARCETWFPGRNRARRGAIGGTDGTAQGGLAQQRNQRAGQRGIVERHDEIAVSRLRAIALMSPTSVAATGSAAAIAPAPSSAILFGVRGQRKDIETGIKPLAAPPRGR